MHFDILFQFSLGLDRHGTRQGDGDFYYYYIRQSGMEMLRKLRGHPACELVIYTQMKLKNAERIFKYICIMDAIVSRF